MLNIVCDKFPRVILALEGGYNLLNIGSGCAAIARVLLEPTSLSVDIEGKYTACAERTDVHSGTVSAIRETCKHHAKSWPFLAAYES
jgi:hypothetical protein